MIVPFLSILIRDAFTHSSVYDKTKRRLIYEYLTRIVSYLGSLYGATCRRGTEPPLLRVCETNCRKMVGLLRRGIGPSQGFLIDTISFFCGLYPSPKTFKKIRFESRTVFRNVMFLGSSRRWEKYKKGGGCVGEAHTIVKVLYC